MNYDRKIVLEDGSEYYGYGFGADVEKVCEIVFNTSMVGYQEIVSDPSYTYQMVVMTYPVIGNYGINDTNVNPTGVGSNINSELNLETNNTPGTAHGVFGNYDINSNLNNDIQANQQEAQVYQQTIKNPTETVFQTYQQTQQPQKQQAVTVVKKVGFWAKIKAFFTGSSTTTVTANNKATSTQVGYNQNLNATNTNGQANNNSTTSKGFWSIFKGNK